MSNLTLNISANDGDLTKLNTAIDRLEAVLKQPVSASVSGLTEQLTALDAKSAESSATLAGLQKTVAAAAAETSVLAASVAEAGAGFEKVSADAGKAKGGIDLLTASMSEYALAMQGTKAEIATTTKLLQTQAKASEEVMSATVALTAAQRRGLVEAQGRANVISLINQEARVQAEMVTVEAAAHDKLYTSMKRETLASAKLQVEKGLMTKARYEAMVSAREEGLAVANLEARFAAEIASMNLLAMSHSELAAVMSISGSSIEAVSFELKNQGDKARLLLEQMAALDPKLREMMVAEQAAAGTISAANKELALQAELTRLMNGEESAYIVTLKAATLAKAKLALAQGVITEARYNDIAGIKVETTALNQEAAALNKVGTASQRAAVAGTTLNGVTRGVAGATGTLWMSYGSVLPLLTAFAVVIGTIKSYKAVLSFEYAVGYMEALGEATGDTTASLFELKKGLLGIKDVAHGPNELAVSLKALMKAGFSAAESMGELQTLSRLATVAEEDLATVTTAVISQFRAWSVESVGAARGVNTMAEAANVLAAAALTTTLDVGELAKMMKYTPVLASQTAVSFVELTAALGTMSNMGVRGTTAATSLRTAMLQLQSPTSKTRGMLSDLGLEIKLFSEEGKLKNMSGMFDALAVSLKNVGDKNRVTILKSLFSIRAGSAGAIMLHQFNKAIQEGTFSFQAQAEMLERVRVEGNFINEMYKDISKTTSVMWEETKAAWERVAVGILDSDAIKDVVRGLKDFAEDGSLGVLIANLGTVVDLLGAMGSIAVKPASGIMSFLSDLNDDINNLRVLAFGATEGFLSMQRAGDLYAKTQAGVVNFTYHERSAIQALVDTYGSLKVAAQAEPFDTRIAGLQQKIEADKANYGKWWRALRNTKDKEQIAALNKKIGDYESLRDELAKQLEAKAKMLEDPDAWKAEQDKVKEAAEVAEQEATKLATSISEARARRELEVKEAKLARANALADDKFYLKNLDQQYKDKLISLDDYRRDKKEKNDEILVDDLALLERELELAKTKKEETATTAESTTAPKGAMKAAINAEYAVLELENKIYQKRQDMIRANITFRTEANSTKLANDREYVATWLSVEKNRASEDKRITLEGLSTQQEMLDSRHAAGLVSTIKYNKETRKINQQALDAEVTDLNVQLAILEQQKVSALALSDKGETDPAIVKLSEEIAKIVQKLKEVARQKGVLTGLATNEDLTTLRAFRIEMEGIEKASQRKADDVDFNISTQSMGGNKQKLAAELRGSKLLRAQRIEQLKKDDSVIDLPSRIEDVNNQFDAVDDATIASAEKMKKASKDTWGGMEKGLNDYAEEAEDVFSHTANLVSSAFSKMEDAMVDFAVTGKLSFTDMANSIISDMIRIMVQQSITGPLASGMGDILGGLLGGTMSTATSGLLGGTTGTATAGELSTYFSTNALGNVFNNGRVQPFASGGIVDSPHVFPLANGAGLMGEAGPEAILPLTRVNGRLGVETSGNSGGETNVVVNNYGDAQKVDVQKRKNSSGGVDIIVSLEKELSDRIKTRGSKLSQTLESTYGFRRVGGR